MEGELSSCLPIAMRMVGDAIRLDSLNCEKEAYCQYLSCCIYISQILKDNAWDKDIKLAYNKDSSKLFKLMQQCQERALTIISSGGSQSETSSTPSSVGSQSISVPSVSDNQHTFASTPPGRSSLGTIRTSSGQLLNFPSPPTSSPISGSQSNSMKPFPRANNQERRMMGHHLRVTRINTNNTDKTLTYLRRMSENLQIAKAREEAIRKKVWERQQRLHQEANRRFASASVDSKEEQEQRALYTKILEFEQDVVWPRQLRAKLKEFPEDASLIKHIIDKIFSSKDHPLRQFLLQYQYHVYLKLLPLLKGVHLKNLNTGKEEDISRNSTTAEASSPNEQLMNQDNNPIEKKKDDKEKGFNRSEGIKEISKDSEGLVHTKDNGLCNQDSNDLKGINKIHVNSDSAENQGNKSIILEDVEAIVCSIMDSILEEVAKSEIIPVENVDQKDCLQPEIEKENNLKVDSGVGYELNHSNEIVKLSRKLSDDAVSQENNSVSTSIVNSSDKEICKHQNFVSIKCFDVDTEFDSLEDDMFDVGNSESEEEVENTRKQSTVSKSNQDDMTTMPGQGSRDDRSTNTEDTELRSYDRSCQEQNQPKLSYEEDLELTRKHLNEIFVDMRFFLEKLKGFIILAYEELATPVGHDQCYDAVEYPFFQPLWPLLLGVLRRVNFDKELSLGGVMTNRIKSTPAEMGVADRLCLKDQESVKLTGNQYPYQAAVDLLQKVAASHCPLEKLDYIVLVLRSICQCVEDYWETKGKGRHCLETSMGCDDILPVLTYVIVRSGMAQLVSECVAMEEFIPEGYLIGEEGYCLTTLQTALSYLLNLDLSCPSGKREVNPGEQPTK